MIGDPIHHHTTLRPLHQDANGNGDRSDDNAAPFDRTNAIADWGANEALTYRDAAGNRGAGTDVDIRINPGSPITGTTSPSDVILAHEMAHAMHETQGTMAPSTTVGGTGPDRNVAQYEHQAAGLGAYASDPNTENAYRRERIALGAPLTMRTSYSVLP
jgi:hypothetical protein